MEENREQRGQREDIQGSYYMFQEPEPGRRHPGNILCRVPLVTTFSEGETLILASMKPVVKLLINRSNNQYSYTPNSGENLLKNIELFEKLSRKFSCRLLFIKDIGSSSEICCWSFYGHGKKCADVCCTSIVYAQNNRKHTKVEFPEARIFDETLSMLLYETPEGPNQELMMRTSYNAHGRTISSCY